VEHVWPEVMTNFPAECSCVPAAARRFLFAAGAIEARFIAWEFAPNYSVDKASFVGQFATA
jgi:hypothetical protein